MLDWDSLIPERAGQHEAPTWTKCPTMSNQKRAVSNPELDSSNPVTARDTDGFLPSVQLVQLKKQGRGKEEGKTARAKLMRWLVLAE